MNVNNSSKFLTFRLFKVIHFKEKFSSVEDKYNAL